MLFLLDVMPRPPPQAAKSYQYHKYAKRPCMLSYFYLALMSNFSTWQSFLPTVQSAADVSTLDLNKAPAKG